VMKIGKAKILKPSTGHCFEDSLRCKWCHTTWGQHQLHSEECGGDKICDTSKTNRRNNDQTNNGTVSSDQREGCIA